MEEQDSPIPKKKRRRRRKINPNSPDLEKSTFICKSCGLEKVRILAGRFDAFNKRYVDENSKAHNGLECSICHGERVKLNMRKVREKKAAEKKSVPEDL